MSQTTAELVVQEDEYHGNFEIKSYFYGEIRVKLYKDSQDILSLEFGDLEDIFPREKGFYRDVHGIFRITRGECKARFGVSQKVELHAKPLPGADFSIRHTHNRNSFDQQNDPPKNSLNDVPSLSGSTAIRRDILNGTNIQSDTNT